MNVCPICAASLSHHTLCMGIWIGSSNCVYMYHIFSLVGQIKKITEKRKTKTVHRTDFEADL